MNDTDTDDWPELRERFSRVVFRRGVRIVASAIPASPVTVYRLINGKTKHPTHAIRAAVERIVSQDDPQP